MNGESPADLGLVGVPKDPGVPKETVRWVPLSANSANYRQLNKSTKLTTRQTYIKSGNCAVKFVNRLQTLAKKVTWFWPQDWPKHFAKT